MTDINRQIHRFLSITHPTLQKLLVFSEHVKLGFSFNFSLFDFTNKLSIPRTKKQNPNVVKTRNKRSPSLLTMKGDNSQS